MQTKALGRAFLQAILEHEEQNEVRAEFVTRVAFYVSFVLIIYPESISISGIR